MCSPNVHYDKPPPTFNHSPIYPLRSSPPPPHAYHDARSSPSSSSLAAPNTPTPTSNTTHHHQHHRHTRRTSPPLPHGHHPSYSYPFPHSASAPSAANTTATTNSAASLHHTITHTSSVLSLAVDEQRGLVFSGSQSERIYVWDLRTYQQRTQLHGHTGSVLALELAPEKNWLFSSSGDNTVRIWDTNTLKPLYVVHTAEDNVGDIFTLRWCRELETLYLGCQNTSIQWICLAGFPSSSTEHTGTATAASTAASASANPAAPPVAAASSAAAAASAASGRPRGADSPKVTTPSAFPISRPHRFFDSVSLSRSRSTQNAPTVNSLAAGAPPTRAKQLQGATAAASGGALDVQDGGNEQHSRSSDGGAKPHGGTADLERTDSTDKVISAASDRLHGISLVAGGDADDDEDAVQVLVLPPTCSVPSAHFGYIYAFDLLTLEGDSPHRKVLVSGSGDESVKLWHATPDGLVHLATLESANSEGNAVMALASWKSTLFAGLQGGDVEVWDLETCTLVRTLRAHDDDVLAIEACSYDGCLFTASADGKIRRWDRSFRCTDEWVAHDGIVLSLAAIRQPVPPHLRDTPQPMLHLITGSSDDLIKIWNLPQQRRGGAISPPLSAVGAGPATTPLVVDGLGFPSAPESSTLLSSLAQFVAYRSISSLEENREDCRQAAHFLKACLTGLGAEAKILANAPGRNPLVLATFKANGPRSRKANGNRTAAAAQPRPGQDASAAEQSSDGGAASERSSPPPSGSARGVKRCLFYGHYDCIAAEGTWDSDPFSMSGRDGYLYGRGVSDNKGPILAAACAASQLLTRRQLDADVVFLIEGEEETGSVGFTDAVRAYKRDIGEIDVILLSNSYWLGEDVPCLTVGLRGVVRATIEVSGDEPDVHSGVEGGAVREPMIDMVKLLSSLTDGDRVTIPGFYDGVRPVSPSEAGEYEAIARLKQAASISPSSGVPPPSASSSTNYEGISASSDRGIGLSSGQEVGSIARSLMAKWRFPSLSVHHLRVSGPGNSTVIPSQVSATVSLRLVPDQRLGEIEEALVRHVHRSFEALYSGDGGEEGERRNKVRISVDHRADWWLGERGGLFHLLQQAVREEWGLSAPTSSSSSSTLPSSNANGPPSTSTTSSSTSTSTGPRPLTGPISIREGGSIPAIAILEKELEAGALHLPMGQSSDRAHLPNERIRLVNLQRGKQVVRRFLVALGEGEGGGEGERKGGM